MKKALLIVVAALGLGFGLGAQTTADTLTVKDAQVYLSMVHTPNGHLLQKAPYASAHYPHLNLGAGPETLRYAYFPDLLDFYDFGGLDLAAAPQGKVSANAKVSVVVPKPEDKNLSDLPEGLSSTKPGLKLAAVVLFGELNKPCFNNSDNTFYWLRPALNAPIERSDGKFQFSFSKLELGLWVWFSGDGVVSGDHQAGEFVYHYMNVPVKKGWNLLALFWGDGSEIFKGDRYVVALTPTQTTYQVFIPYW